MVKFQFCVSRQLLLFLTNFLPVFQIFSQMANNLFTVWWLFSTYVKFMIKTPNQLFNSQSLFEINTNNGFYIYNQYMNWDFGLDCRGKRCKSTGQVFPALYCISFITDVGCVSTFDKTSRKALNKSASITFVLQGIKNKNIAQH